MFNELIDKICETHDPITKSSLMEELGRQVEMVEKFPMKVVCCVCGVQYGEKEATKPDQISHGYCQNCKEVLRKEMLEDVEEAVQANRAE